MAKSCDICGKKIGFKAFHCLDGKLCKECYQLVSNQFTSTITGKTLAELKQLYERNAAPTALGEDGFSVTRKVGTFLLLDEEHKKFALPSNRSITKQYTRMEVFPWSSLKSYSLVSNPKLSAQRLGELPRDTKNAAVVNSLLVRLCFTDGTSADIPVIPTPVRSSSFAWRQGYTVALELTGVLEEILRTQEESC